MLMVNRSISKKLLFVDLGRIDYKKAWDLQKTYFNKRSHGDIDDIIFICEHNHTYTLGKVANKKNLLLSELELKEKGIDVYEIDRGGDITYHGPGQVVGYPILDLSNWKTDTNAYLRSLEEVIIKTCGEYGIEAERNDKFTGVWIGNRKICAIGIKINKWITMHGFALNVNTDLNLFNGIIPCGITDKEVTSMQKELGMEISIDEVKTKVLKNFIEVFEYQEYSEKKVNEKKTLFFS